MQTPTAAFAPCSLALDRGEWTYRIAALAAAALLLVTVL